MSRRTPEVALGAALLLASIAIVHRPPGSDATSLVLPYLALMARGAARGEPFPLWDDTVFGGIPLVADPRHQLFYPFSWLAFVMPAERAIGVILALHVVIASLGARALARTCGASRPGAALAAFVYGLAQVTFFDVLVEGFVDYAPGIAWTPWILHFGMRVLRRARRRDLPAGAVAMAMFLLGTHVNGALIGSALLALIFAVELVARPRPRSRRSGLVLLAVLFVTGVALAAPRWAPLLDYARESTRGPGSGAPRVFNEDLDSFQAGARLLTGLWAGLVPLVLAAVAVSPGLRFRARCAPVAGIAAGGVAAALLALGPRTFAGRWFFALPVFDQINAQGLHLWFVALPIAVTAGRGLDRLIRRRNRASVAEGAAALFVVSVLAVGLLGLRGELPFYAADLRARIAFFEGLPDATDPAMLGDPAAGDVRAVANVVVPARRLLAALAVAAAWLATAGVAGGVTATSRRPRHARSWLAATVMVALAADLSLTHYAFLRDYWEPLVPPAAPDVTDTITPSAARVAALEIAGADPRSSISGPAARIHGFRGLLGNGFWMDRHWAELIEARQGALDLHALSEPRDLVFHDLDPMLARMLDVGWLARSRSDGGVEWSAPASPPLGRAWVLCSQVAVGDETAARAAVAEADFDPQRSVVISPREGLGGLIEMASSGRFVACDGAIEPPAAVVEESRSTRLRVTLGAPVRTPSYLVLSESYGDGWRARVDGRDTLVLRGDLALRVVPLPVGAQSVVLDFWPASLTIGLVMAGAGGMALARWSLGAQSRRARTRPIGLGARSVSA